MKAAATARPPPREAARNAHGSDILVGCGTGRDGGGGMKEGAVGDSEGGAGGGSSGGGGGGCGAGLGGGGERGGGGGEGGGDGGGGGGEDGGGGGFGTAVTVSPPHQSQSIHAHCLQCPGATRGLHQSEQKGKWMSCSFAGSQVFGGDGGGGGDGSGGGDGGGGNEGGGKDCTKATKMASSVGGSRAGARTGYCAYF